MGFLLYMVYFSKKTVFLLNMNKEETIRAKLQREIGYVLDNNLVTQLLNGMVEYSTHAHEEDYEPVLDFAKAKQTLDTFASLFKIVVDNDTKIEVANITPKKDDEFGNEAVILPDGNTYMVSQIKNIGKKDEA